MNKVFLLTLSLFFAYTAGFTQTHKKPVSTLIIDPGHGGLDPGAKGLFTKEAQLALEVSLRLGDTMAKAYPDMKIIFTRTTDILPGNSPTKDAGLKYRAKLANDNHGDLFVSIHLNSSGLPPGGTYQKKVVNKIPHTRKVKKGKKTVTQTYYEYEYETVWVPNKAKGTETYVWAVNKNESKMSHIQKNQEFDSEDDSTSTLTLPDPNDPSEKARMLVYMQNYFRKSLNLASYVQEEFKDHGRVDRGVKQRNDKGIWVLQATAMPSILIEIGFITNKEEEEYMASEAGQKEITANIFTALKKYIDKLEEKSREKDADEGKGEKKGF